METELITMSIKEVEKLKIYQQLDARTLKQKHAATMLGLTTRQIRNTIKDYKKDGPIALVSKRRGRKSNRAYNDSIKNNVTSIIRDKYTDFGPTLASEYLLERHQLKYAKETVRGWMIEDGLWKPKKEKHKVVHQPRPRRACFGELIQIDGSPHAWFEDRGEYCCLITFIDDATSKIVLARFFPAETTFAYMSMMQEYIAKYGKPAALYSDKHSVFRVNALEAESGTGFTQFGRAMRDLGITVHHANSAPAKGRVERSNLTQQDRFIKWLRIEGISDPETANKHIDRYMELQHNAKFAVAPRESKNLHTIVEDMECLKYIFTIQCQRSVSKNLTLQYKNKTYVIQVPGKGYRLRQAKVTVCEDQSGKITLLHNNKSLSYKVYDKNQHYSETVTAKELPTKFKESSNYKPDQDHPWNKAARLSAVINAERSQAQIPRH
jgi:transposase